MHHKLITVLLNTEMMETAAHLSYLSPVMLSATKIFSVRVLLLMSLLSVALIAPHTAVASPRTHPCSLLRSASSQQLMRTLRTHRHTHTHNGKTSYTLCVVSRFLLKIPFFSGMFSDRFMCLCVSNPQQKTIFCLSFILVTDLSLF